MRRRYIKSHYQLQVTLWSLLFSTIVLAKEKPKETNIVCFAAKNKWVCAPEDQQEIANEKASKLLVNKNSDLESAGVVIKSINIPKFNTSNKLEPIKDTIAKDKIINSETVAKEKPEPVKTNGTNNPYAELWSHQLIGVSTPQNAINYVRKHALNKQDILIIQSTRKGMDWWIILFGLYKDKQTGLDNQDNLPKNINDSWLRPLKNLQVNGFIENF